MRVWTLPFLLLALPVACTDDKAGTDSGTPTGDTEGDADTDADGDADTDTDTDTDVIPDAECVDAGGACLLTGTYTSSMKLTADKAWLLRSGVLIGDDSADVTLEIEPGTQVYGESATNGFLVITRGAKINAVGTSSDPIVFQPDLPAGSRARGSWGGVVLNGRAPINGCADGTALCEAEGEGGTGKYGGNDPDDNSGTLKYAVIMFGGTEISPDNEINGLTVSGAGRGTVLDYIQVHMNSDDGIEFFGGTADAKHLVVTGAGDDNIDWDLGWQGRVQFAVIQQAPDSGNNGFEADNNEADHTATPFSQPTFSHVTIVGSEDIDKDNFAVVLRRGTAGYLHNVAALGFTTGCLAVRDQATFDHFSAGDSAFAHARFGCDDAFEVDKEESETMTEEEVFAAGSDNQIVADLKIADPFDQAAPDFRPVAGSTLLTGGASPADSFFTSATYIGAFDQTTDWTAGWTVHVAN